MHEYRLCRQPDAPVLNIPDVALHAALHLPQFPCLSTESRHLGPARQPRLHEVAHHVFVYQLRVLFRMQQHVRSWAYKTHVTLQHVQELRQLIYIRLAHKIAERILPRIILCRLHLVCILVHVHRALWRKYP